MAEVNGMRIAVLKRTATARVTGIVRGFQHQSEFTIPTQVEENGMTFRVTEIDDAAFRNCSALTSITIPEGIVRIGKLAFAECSSLTSITIPKTVTQIDCGEISIGDNYYYGHLFTNCPSLTSIVVEEGNPKYKTIQNGNGIIDKTTNTLIAGDQSTIIPNSVTSIGRLAFARCTLTSITIPNSVTSIGYEAFRGCGALSSVTIPDSVTSIGNGAFAGCNKLTSVTIPDSVTSIGNEAFRGCNKLTSVTIGNSANNIIGADLGASQSLTSINVDVNNPNYCSIDGVLFDKNQTTLIRYSRGKQGAYIIPDSVTSIGERAFYDCDALTSITIPNSVTSIGDNAFNNCDALTSVTIGNSANNIIRASLGASPSLTSINVDVNNPNYCSIDGVLFDKNQTTLIRYSRGKQGAYIIPDSVTSIGERAFYDCDALTSITIPNSVTSIGDYAFSCCRALTSVTIPNSVTSIGDGAFRWCRALTSVTIPNSVTSIGDYAFYDCDALTSVTIPNSVTIIRDHAFCNCDALTSVTIPNSVRSIGDCAFYLCDALTSVTIENEEGKVAIGVSAFPDKAKITYVGKPKEQPAKPAEKEIAQPKAEEPKATAQANPAVTIDLEKLIAAALIDGVVTDKERAILIKKVKEAGGDVDEFEMLLDARIYEAQQKQAQQQPTKPVEKEIQQTKSQPTPEVRKAKGSLIDRIKNFFK